MDPMSAAGVAAALGLRPHPEGGRYRETWRDEPGGGARGLGSSILFLLAAGERSRRHRLDATEIWHFHAGAPLELTVERPGSGAPEVHLLGIDLAAGARPQVVVPAGAWQSARSRGSWTLVGCTVAPAFTFEGFEIDDAEAADRADSGYPSRVTRDGGVSGIVLAGGTASRFGSPKLAAILDGRPLLEHALDAVAAVCDEVIVVCGPGGEPALAHRPIPLSVIHDPEPFAGPRAALLAAAGTARHPLAVVVGGDMPWIRPAFLRALVDCLAADDRSASAPILYGIIQPLPFAARVARLRSIGVPGHGSLLALLEALRVAPLPEPAWRPLDPDGASLQDVDRPEDLAGPLELPLRGWSATWARPTSSPGAGSSRPGSGAPAPPARRSPASR